MGTQRARRLMRAGICAHERETASHLHGKSQLLMARMPVASRAVGRGSFTRSSFQEATCKAGGQPLHLDEAGGALTGRKHDNDQDFELCSSHSTDYRLQPSQLLETPNVINHASIGGVSSSTDGSRANNFHDGVS